MSTRRPPLSNCPIWAAFRRCAPRAWMYIRSAPSATATLKTPRTRAIYFVANARDSFTIAALCASYLIPIRSVCAPDSGRSASLVRLQQYALDAAVVGAAHVFLQPVRAQDVAGHLHDDVVRLHA